MKNTKMATEKTMNGGKVMRLIAALAKFGKKLNLSTLPLAINEINWASYAVPTISGLVDGIDYCLTKGLAIITDDNEIQPSLAASHIAKNGMLNAMGIALEYISIVNNGELSYKNFLDNNNDAILFAVLSAGFTENDIDQVRELLLKWHCIRATSLGTVIAE